MSALRRAMSSSPRSISAANRLSTVSRHLSSNSAMESESPVHYSTESGARIYKLNRPKQLNALNYEMISSLVHKVENWRKSEICKVVIGRGDARAFCAGGDVKSLVLELEKGDSSNALNFFKDEFQLNWAIARLGKPYVSVMHGITMGGGCGIALPAPIRIATSSTHFAMPETKIGYAPDVGVSYYLAQLDGNIGAWLALTGQDVYGRAAYELGLASHYVLADSLDAVVESIAQLDNPTEKLISTIVSSFAPATPKSSSHNSKANPDGHTSITGEIRTFLDEAFGKASVQEIYSALQSASSNDSLSADVKAWAKEQAEIISQRSPTGMAVALNLYKQAKASKRLDVVLQTDMKMATAFVGPARATQDFVTGVTSVLITREKTKPKWSPEQISQVDSTLVDQFFKADSPAQKDRPELVFNPKPSSKITSGKDSTWGQFRKYGLPSESEIEAMVEGSAPGSGAFKIKTDELVERILDERGESGGSRAEEITSWTKTLVSRLCDVKENGYLDWKREAK